MATQLSKDVWTLNHRVGHWISGISLPRVVYISRAQQLQISLQSLATLHLCCQSMAVCSSSQVGTDLAARMKSPSQATECPYHPYLPGQLKSIDSD